MKDDECICRECIKTGFSLSCLAIDTYVIAFLYNMTSRTSLHPSLRLCS